MTKFYKMTILVMLLSILYLATEIKPSVDNLPILYSQSVSSVVKFTGKYVRETIFGTSVENDGYGTGFIVDKKKGLIVTAGHVVKRLKDTKIKLITGEITSFNIKVEDEDNDVTIIQVDAELLKNIPELKLSFKSYIGESIYSIGNPLKFNNIITSGIISSDLKYSKKFEPPHSSGVLISDMYLDSGNSGSPVMNSEGGVIGMATSVMNGFSIIVPSFVIQNLIDSIN